MNQGLECLGLFVIGIGSFIFILVFIKKDAKKHAREHSHHQPSIEQAQSKNDEEEAPPGMQIPRFTAEELERGDQYKDPTDD